METNNAPAPVTNHPELQGRIDPPTKDQTPAQKEAKRFLTAKVNGKEELISEEQLLRDYQKYRSGDERLAQATQKEKQIQSFMQQLETDPDAAFKQTGLSKEKKKELAERWLTEQLEEELRDPREAELMELKAKIEGYEGKEKQTKEEAEQESQQAARVEAVQKRQAHFQETFSKALELSPLSENPETAAEALRGMALHYRLAKSQGYEPDPQELASVVEERSLRSMRSAVSSLDGEALVKVLGKDIIKKLRQYDMAQLGISKGPEAPATESDWSPSEPRRKEKFTSTSDMIREARRSK
ncbi:MAG: hypothetical protein M3Q07_05535 [Pseudobdellovibrionaceae bacterium]|nr:hypothetical protein [Pseudobdellovibrionaceae bacterium]